MPYTAYLVLNVICVLIGFFAAQPSGFVSNPASVTEMEQRSRHDTPLCNGEPLDCRGFSGNALQSFKKWNKPPESLTNKNCLLSDHNSRASIPHTPRHRDCPACDVARVRPLTNTLSDATTFRIAAQAWIASRSFAGVRHRFIAPRTLADEKQWIDSLNKFFADLQLSEIHAGHIRTYQEQRAKGELSEPNPRWAKRGLGAGPQKINQEIGLLIRIMKRANCWTEELNNAYEPFQQPESDIPRALTTQEQDRFLYTAASKENWQVVYWYATVALRVGFSNEEMRGIRRGDYNLASQIITVQAAHAKRRNRIRTVPLTPDAIWALERLEDRAKELGSVQPQHYLFPFGVKHDEYDPARCMTNSGIKKAWQEVREAAGVPWLRQHDLRHTAITRWAESGMPIAIIMSLAGHMTQKMLMHYTHISAQAAQLAMQGAYQRKPSKAQSSTSLWKSAKRV